MAIQSNLFPAQIIDQTTDTFDDIEWQFLNDPQTVRNIRHISNSSVGAVRERTWFINFLHFKVDETLPNVITGIKLITKCRRRGRVFDETIAIRYGGNIVSDNKTSYISDVEQHLYNNDIMTYGGEGDLWGAVITSDMVRDPSWGITMRFQAHPMYPHNDGMQVDQVQICFYGE
jgi:hypothetical protein